MSRFKKRKEDPEAEPEFQVAPMADMLFVLLVFFMSITTTEVMQSQIDDLELPFAKETTKEDEEAKDRKDIVINVRWDPKTRQPEIFYNMKLFNTPQELVPAIQAQLELNPLAKVLIRADVDTEFDFVSQVMRSVGDAGVGSVSFGVITGGGGPREDGNGQADDTTAAAH